MSIIFVSAYTVYIDKGLGQNIPQSLQLKAPKDQILGTRIFRNGDVQYAYKSNIRVSDLPSQQILSEAGKRSLQVSTEIIEKRTANSKTFRTNRENVFVSEFVSGAPQYHKDKNNKWWQVEYGTTTQDAFNEQTTVSLFEKLIGRKALAATSTFFPDPDPETVSIDGQIRNNNADWSTARDATSANDVSQAADQIDCGLTGLGGGQYYIGRGFYLFNTSAIGDGDVINSATFSLIVGSKLNGDNDGLDYINIYSSNPASDTNLVFDDFDQIGSTPFAMGTSSL